MTATPPEVFQFLARYGALKLEILGLRHSRGSVYALCKRVYALRGTKASVLAQMNVIKQKLLAGENNEQDTSNAQTGD